MATMESIDKVSQREQAIDTNDRLPVMTLMAEDPQLPKPHSAMLDDFRVKLTAQR